LLPRACPRPHFRSVATRPPAPPPCRSSARPGTLTCGWAGRALQRHVGTATGRAALRPRVAQ
jgi:hypothetical protein